MQPVNLYPHQQKAVGEMHNGCVLVGGVGTGKSRAAMAYFVTEVCNGVIGDLTSMKTPRDIIVITTPKKRNDLDWEEEAIKFGIGVDRRNSIANISITVDSWNNIRKYEAVKDAFFVFDEQRIVGSGSWSKSFLKIAANNQWILLSATPGDTWMDYVPLFIANGFYKNRTEFKRDHVIYNSFAKFPKVDRYINTGKLVRCRNAILIEMPYEKHTVRRQTAIIVDYDEELYKFALKKRWHVFENRPVRDIAELFIVLRRIVNSDPSRLRAIWTLSQQHPRLIVFYSFNYELEILRTINGGTTIAELNGHKHDEIPTTDSWLYLVQYTAGAEGWECTETDATAFYSQTYSYRVHHQAHGRIDRLTTPYIDLYYYSLISKAPIDLAIKKALNSKKSFNESAFASKFDKKIFGSITK